MRPVLVVEDDEATRRMLAETIGEAASRLSWRRTVEAALIRTGALGGIAPGHWQVRLG